MKYKAGDRVRVIARVNTAYLKEQPGLFVRFTEKMSKFKIVTITDVLAQEGIYLVNENPWEYTDEMLDGLVDEPEGEPEKPTDAELIQAAELLKANCKNQKDCNKCIFLSKVCCKFEYKTPEEWELPHRKTRKEALLEKFPNIRVDACGIPCLNPCEMDPIYSNNNCLGKWEHDCASCRKGYWNASAESEEDK